MKRGTAISTAPESEIRVLIFRTGGVTFGADMRQIKKMLPVQGEHLRGVDLYWLHQILRFQTDVVYAAPMVLLLHLGAAPGGVVIDQPIDVNAAVPFSAIKPLPEMIRRSCPNHPIAGAFIQKADMILIIDLIRLVLERK